ADERHRLDARQSCRRQSVDEVRANARWEDVRLVLQPVARADVANGDAHAPSFADSRSPARRPPGSERRADRAPEGAVGPGRGVLRNPDPQLEAFGERRPEGGGVEEALGRSRPSLACDPPSLAQRLRRARRSENGEYDLDGRVGIGPPAGVDGEWPPPGTRAQPVADQLAVDHERACRATLVPRPRAPPQPWPVRPV